ncbi:hypothetical protein [Caballeronia sp. HLA56]
MLNTIRGTCLALGAALVVGGLTLYYDDQDVSVAQADTDRATVDCLTQQLTHDEKVSIARLTVDHDNANMRRVYTDVLSRCVLRADQWDRRSQLVASARQTLAYDTEFRRMLSESTMRIAQRP